MRRRLTCTLFLVAMLLGVSACDKSQKESATATPSTDSSVSEKADVEEADEEKESKPAGSPKTLEELPEGVNALQNEMQLLNSAMQTTLTLIANDQLEGIPAQIKKVHPARQLTMKAVKTGVYKTPQNPDQVDEFVEMDDAFHDDLKALLKASKDDDLQAATDAYKGLVQGCTSCHTKFRFAPSGE